MAIVLVSNTQLTRTTTSERLAAGEADWATVSTTEAMASLAATGNVRTVMDAATPANDDAERESTGRS